MKKIIIYSIILLNLLLAFSTYTFFTFSHHKDSARIQKAINEFQKKNILNGTILVAQNDTIIFRKAFGIANKELNKLNSFSSQFLLASITKTYTAVAILLLVQKRIIDLLKPVSEYLKQNHSIWQGKMPNSMNKITIHDLLTHSSGLADYEKIPGYPEWYKKIHTPEEIIQFFAYEPLSFAPGSRYDYQGSNYLLLGFIIEAVSGITYEAYLKKMLFNPFNLSYTFAHVNAFLSDIQKTNPNISLGYRLDKHTHQLQPAGMVNMSVDYAESSIISNALDLYLFISDLFSNKIIAPEMVQKMTTSYFTTSYNAGVGYGIYIDKDLNYPIFNHPGRIDGYESIFLYEPQKKITVIILSNVMGSNIYPLAYELMDIIHSHLKI